MDIESKQAVRLLESFADCGIEFLKLAQKMQPHPDVVRVSHDFECKKYQSGSLIEGYVDLELKNGKSLCWWLEVSWSPENWLIDSRIMINDSEGQVTAHKFEDKTPTSFNDFLVQLAETMQELVHFDAFGLIGTMS